MTGGGRSRVRVLGFALALVAASVWLAALATGRGGGAWLVAKGAAMPLVALAVAAAGRRSPGRGGVALALVLHGAGDLLLEVAFLAGVAAFFAGHLVYLRTFWRARLSLDDVGGGIKVAVGLLGLFAALFLAFLSSRLTGALTAAIPLYVAALAAMGGAAWWCARGRPWVPLGATLFVASDALLGLQLFAGGVPGGRLLVWPLYVAGQLAIAAGWTRPVSSAPAPAGEPPA